LLPRGKKRRESKPSQLNTQLAVEEVLGAWRRRRRKVRVDRDGIHQYFYNFSSFFLFFF
jgi:hypothetical protein